MILSPQDILFLQNRVAYMRDEQAYKKLFFHFHVSLYRFTNNMVQNATVADEIVSDAMMKVWELGSRLAQVEKLHLYLITVVKNASLTYLSHKKQSHTQLDEAVENNIADQALNAENNLLVSELSKMIQAAVESLPPQCKMVYQLIKEEGLSYKDVCTILEVSQNTIETHMRIALKKIRVSLSGYLNKKI